MRKEFSTLIEELACIDERIIFITGDLGFGAFENLQKSIGKRFINAGVAEQNMIGVAAGMAHKGFKVFCYSIAPFIVYRCLEQFRNDVCFHDLPVFLVGNGGGYGYGIMGSTHHAIEDLSAISPLPNIKCWTPSFNDDLENILPFIIKENRPVYLRLNNSRNSPVRYNCTDNSINVLYKGESPGCTIIAMGPVVNNVLSALQSYDTHASPDVFVVTSFPLVITEEFVLSLKRSRKLIVVEEHVSVGGLGQQLSLLLTENYFQLEKFVSLHAKGYPDGLYGDQNYHQKMSGIDEENILKILFTFNS